MKKLALFGISIFAESRQKAVILSVYKSHSYFLNAHMVHEHFKNPHFENVLEYAEFVFPDGMPLVSTSVGSISEIVEDVKNGFLYNYGELKTPFERIISLYNHSELRNDFSENNRKKASSKFDTKVCEETHLRACNASIK